jgi:predicted RNase H-like nuclease (RuvC/YqgF family)
MSGKPIAHYAVMPLFVVLILPKRPGHRPLHPSCFSWFSDPLREREAVFCAVLMGEAMAANVQTPKYSSPLSKLAPLFEKSRDAWKQKCQQAKKACKLLKNRVRALEESRRHWRELAQVRQQRIQELERQVEELKNISAASASA